MEDQRGAVFWRAFKDTMPLGLGVFVFGTVYGVMAAQTGLTLAETVSMSVLVLAGSSQFVAVGMLAQGIPAAQVIFSTLLINIRYLLMGASLAPFLRGVKLPGLALAAHLTTDESYAMSMNHFRAKGGSAYYLMGSGFNILVTWSGGSAVGFLAGQLVGDLARWGLDFVFVAAFIALLVPQLKGRTLWVVGLVSALVSTATAQVLPGMWYIMAAVIAAVAAGVTFEHYAHGNGPADSGDGGGNLAN